GRTAAAGFGTKRIVAEPNLRFVQCNTVLLQRRRQILSGVLVLGTEIEFERNAGVQVDTVEGSGDRVLRTSEAVTVGAHAAGEHKAQSGCAILEIVQSLLVGRFRVGMIHALDHLPGHSGAARDWQCAGRAGVKGLNSQAIVRLTDKPLVKRRTLEGSLD